MPSIPFFGKEPTDPEIEAFILTNYHELQFSQPISLNDVQIKIKRTNPKRLKREAKKQLEKAEKYYSFAQDALRQELEQNKQQRKSTNSEQREAEQQRKFDLKQQKKKQKHKGH